jgi:hypothetical protein
LTIWSQELQIPVEIPTKSKSTAIHPNMQHDAAKPQIPMHVVPRSKRENQQKLRGSAFSTTAHVKTSAKKVFPKKFSCTEIVKW